MLRYVLPPDYGVLVDGGVTTAKLADGSVTPIKFAASAIDAADGVASARTLGSAAGQAAPGAATNYLIGLLGTNKVDTTRTVAGKPLSANVTLVKADVGLGSVDNTADSAKPVSTPQNTALNLRPLKSRLWFDVKDYGAVGDGTTDDTAAIQAAINACAGAGGSGVGTGTLHFTKGTYKITSALTLYRQAVIFIGDGVGNATNFASKPGNGTTIVWAGAAGGVMFDVADSNWSEWRNLQLCPGSTSIPKAAIYFRGEGGSMGSNERFKITSCKIGRNPWGQGTGNFQYGVLVAGPTNQNNDEFAVDDCTIEWCTVAGISVQNTQSIWGTIRNTKTAYCETGIEVYADINIWNWTNTNNNLDFYARGGSHSIHGYYSEDCKQAIKFDTSVIGNQLRIYGGKLLLGADVGSYWPTGGYLPIIDVDDLAGEGLLLLEGLWVFNQTLYTGSPHQHVIKVRSKDAGGGSIGYQRGHVVIRNCGQIDPLLNLDIATVAAGTGATYGLYYDIDCGATWLRGRLIGTQTLTPTLQGSVAVSNLALPTQNDRVEMTGLDVKKYVSGAVAASLMTTAERATLASLGGGGAALSFVNGQAISGRSLFTPNITGDLAGWLAGTIYAEPLAIDSSVTIDRLICNMPVVGSAGAKIRMLLFDNNAATGMPGAVLVDGGQVAADAGTGVKTVAISKAVTPGIYWVAVIVQGAPATKPTLTAHNGVPAPLIANYGDSAITAAQVGVASSLSTFTGAVAVGTSGTVWNFAAICPKVGVHIA